MKNVETHEAESELYTQEDIDAAIDTIKKEFRENWKGCALTEIYDDWNWILVRKDGGEWEHVDHGY